MRHEVLHWLPIITFAIGLVVGAVLIEYHRQPSVKQLTDYPRVRIAVTTNCRTHIVARPQRVPYDQVAMAHVPPSWVP